jgi:imidazolonepropionase-like amidohydrolase
MATSDRRLVLRATRIIDGTGAAPIEDGGLALQGSRIVAVGPYREVVQEGEDEVVDFAGKTILPGLVDAHCHLTLTGTGLTYEQMALDPDELMAVRAVHNSQVHLRSGVTTLRDNGGRNRVTFIVREGQRLGYFRGPRLLLSGRPLTHTGGHFHWCNGVADGPEEIRRAVRLLVSEGADHIKIMASGGMTLGNDVGLPSYTVEEMSVAVETAHSLGRLTTAHCRATRSMVNAIEAGLDCMEHAAFHHREEPERYGEGGRLPPPPIRYDPAVAEELARSGMFVSLTMQTSGYHTQKRLEAKEAREGLTPLERQRLAAIKDFMEQKVAVLNKLLGLDLLPRIVISTDSGPDDMEFGRLYYGMELGVAGGMTPMQCIQAVTKIAAEACGVSKIVGTLEPGKEADVVVVDGNPLDNISIIGKVVAVYRGGLAVPDPGPPPEP